MSTQPQPSTALAAAGPPPESSPAHNGDPVIRAAGIWKIFGSGADKILGTPDAELSRTELRAEDRLRRRRARRLDRRLAGRGLRRHGALRLRQVDARAHADPADRADGRLDRAGRKERHRRQRLRAPRAAPPLGLDDLPALRTARASPGGRERGLRPRDPGRAERRAPRAGATDAQARRSGGRREPVSRPALGRHAAARRRRARLRRRPEGDALRRAVQRPRPTDPTRHAGRGDAAPARDREDDGLHHA